MADPCASQLIAASTCVQSDPSTCSCFSQPFDTAFPNEISLAYRTTLAFEVPGSEPFCTAANENVCVKLEVGGSCCCQTEVHDYISCSFEQSFNPIFGVSNCPFSKCGGEESSSSMSLVMMAAIAAAILLCCCCSFVLCLLRRRRVRKRIIRTTKLDKETKDDSDSCGQRDIESTGELTKKKQVQVSDSEESETRRVERRSKMTKKYSKKVCDSDSDESETRREERRHKMTKKASRKKLDSESRYRMEKKYSRKGIDTESDSEEDRSRDNRRGRKADRRSHDSDSDDDSWTQNNKRKSKDKSRKSKNRHDSDEESDSSHHRGNRNYVDDDDSVTRHKKSVEQSVRQARTILKTVKKSKKDGVSVEVQHVMNEEMNSLLAQLREQRDEMERRLRASEMEASKLRLEKETSKQTIVEVHREKLGTSNTVNGPGVTQVVTTEMVDFAAELELARKERLEMTKVIKKLEKAKETMEDKLNETQQEATALRTENLQVSKKMTDLEKDREELRLKLHNINETRGDIETRLKIAEEETRKLKDLKKTKTKEIREERESTHVRQSYLDEMETERKGISRNLKKIEEEKHEMMARMAQLEDSQQRLTALIESDEQSLVLDDLASNKGCPHVNVAPTQKESGFQPPNNNTKYTPEREYTSQSLSYDRHKRANPNMPMTGGTSYDSTGIDMHTRPSMTMFPRPSSMKGLGSSSVRRGQPDTQSQGQLRRTMSSATVTRRANNGSMPQQHGGDCPNGWLANDIANRSFTTMGVTRNDFLMHEREPQTFVHYNNGTNASWVMPQSQQVYQQELGSQVLREKRERARNSERRLRSELDRSRSNRNGMEAMYEQAPGNW